MSEDFHTASTVWKDMDGPNSVPSDCGPNLRKGHLPLTKTPFYAMIIPNSYYKFGIDGYETIGYARCEREASCTARTGWQK